MRLITRLFWGHEIPSFSIPVWLYSEAKSEIWDGIRLCIVYLVHSGSFIMFLYVVPDIVTAPHYKRSEYFRRGKVCSVVEITCPVTSFFLLEWNQFVVLGNNICTSFCDSFTNSAVKPHLHKILKLMVRRAGERSRKKVSSTFFSTIWTSSSFISRVHCSRRSCECR